MLDPRRFLAPARLTVARYDLPVSADPVLAMSPMELARLAFGMRRVTDEYGVADRIWFSGSHSIRLPAHFHEKVAWVETEALKLPLEVRFLIAE